MEPKRLIRLGSPEDAEALARVEAACFPPAEAAPLSRFRERLAHYAGHFWLMEEEGRIISFVDGMVTDRPDLTDEMYENAALHDERGAWQMIFGVNTLPEFRRQGCAGALMKRAVQDARAQGRRGLVLTCKERLIPWYAGFGFRSEGTSSSVHGGAVWVQMRLVFPDGIPEPSDKIKQKDFFAS